MMTNFSHLAIRATSNGEKAIVSFPVFLVCTVSRPMERKYIFAPSYIPSRRAIPAIFAGLRLIENERIRRVRAWAWNADKPLWGNSFPG